MKLYTITELQEIKEKMQLTRIWNGLQDWIDYAKELAGQLDRATDTAIEAARERDSLRAALESLTSAWFAGVSGSPDRTETSRYCVYCSGYMSFTSAVNTNETPFAHKPDCPIVRARKLLEATHE